MKRLLLILTLTISTVLNIFAQGTTDSSALNSSAQTIDKDVATFEESEKKLYASSKNPPEYIANLSEILNKYPYKWQVEGIVIIGLRDTLKNVGVEETKVLMARLLKDTESADPALKTMLYSSGAGILVNHQLYGEAAELAQKNIPLLNETEYVDYKRKMQEQTTADYLKKNPSAKPRAFDLNRAKVDFIGLKTKTYNTLGKSFWENGKYEQSEKAYRDSYAVKNTKDAALGIARTAEKNGKNEEALKYATAAVLTGAVDPSEMKYFQALYVKLYPGKEARIEEYLDQEFRKTYQNPIKAEARSKTAKRSNRTVLVEFVTGAGCVPCIPFDYAFEKVLEEFPRKDVSLLVYHTHAPTHDPLANYSADSRYKYYNLNGAPYTFIDGKKLESESDYNGGEDRKETAQKTYESIIKNLNTNLEVPADAQLKLKASKSGQNVKVNVEAGKFQSPSDDITLQIALVENEVSYSGENGLRFQMKVVRVLAGNEAEKNYGFKIEPAQGSKISYSFDVDKIIAQNAAYYETYPAVRMAELSKMWGGKVPEGIKIEFKYHRNQINSKNLSVIAFLQDNKTKKILQSAASELGGK